MHKLSRKIFLLLLAIVLPIMLINSHLTSYANTTDISSVYLGGTPIGIVVKCNGVVIMGFKDVKTEDGHSNPARDAGLMIDDMIYMVNNININSPEKLIKTVESEYFKSTILKLKILRRDEYIDFEVTPHKDNMTNKPKLGIMVKNEISGIGTLTYVSVDGKYFAGLGHKIFDNQSGNTNQYNDGTIYKAEIMGCVQSSPGTPGELKGRFDLSDYESGILNKNAWNGVFGDAKNMLHTGRPVVRLGERSSVKLGEAYIYTTISGRKPEKYKIEIVKASVQDNPAEKGMIIKVTDTRLLKKTAGILQGMSGSPIVQDGKLIGAVTHVFLNDSSLGFGIYIDWMIN